MRIIVDRMYAVVNWIVVRLVIELLESSTIEAVDEHADSIV
ncbi:hypothetical protein QG37_02478 [Candidozyma auris]|uniref:Uncharacterized protein n=1 Tax=Candidozyma auris TaxID=498019 RepID=A0A0L0P242_CANAR|nr:hypothetical protein QG37_02478 [[Candida] auris]